MPTSSIFTRHNEGDLAYVHNGIETGTPLVFLHGFGDMGECWLCLMRDLDLAVPMYALDAPAHGHSKVNRDEEYTQQIARRAAAFARELGRPAVLVGHSMGALQAMHIAGDEPSLVAALVLEDPPVAKDLSLWRDPQTLGQLEGWIRKMQRQSREVALANVRDAHPNWNPEEFEPWVDSKRAVDMSFVGEFTIHREPMDVTLSRIACPALLLTGEPGPAIVTAENAAWAQELCPTMEVAHFPGASHDVRRDAPAEVASAITNFLRKHDLVG